MYICIFVFKKNMPRLLTGMDHPALAATEYAALHGGIRSYNAPRSKQVKQKDGTFTARPSSLSSGSLMKEMGMVLFAPFYMNGCSRIMESMRIYQNFPTRVPPNAVYPKSNQAPIWITVPKTTN